MKAGSRNAAIDLVRAVDRLRLLQQCERASGKAWVTDADRFHVLDGHCRYTGRQHRRTERQTR